MLNDNVAHTQQLIFSVKSLMTFADCTPNIGCLTQCCLFARSNGKDKVLAPSKLHNVFKFKKFPKGLCSVGAMVVEKLGKSVGKDFGEVKNPYGDAWEVSWADGKVEMIKNPLKNLALSLQVGQEIMVDGKLHKCSKYDKGCHLTPVAMSESSSGGGAAGTRAISSPSKRKAESQQTPKKSKKSKKDKTTKWKRCRARKLTNAQRSILSEQYKDKSLADSVSIIFAERSCQEYMELQKSPMHLNCKNILTAAIGQVMCQVVPDTDKPLGGNVEQVCDILFPICQKVREPVLLATICVYVASNDVYVSQCC